MSVRVKGGKGARGGHFDSSEVDSLHGEPAYLDGETGTLSPVLTMANVIAPLHHYIFPMLDVEKCPLVPESRRRWRGRALSQPEVSTRLDTFKPLTAAIPASLTQQKSVSWDAGQRVKLPGF